METVTKKTSGKRKLINAAYILLTAALIMLYVAPSAGNDVFSQLGSYFASIGNAFGSLNSNEKAPQNQLAHIKDQANRTSHITGIGTYKDANLVIPKSISEHLVTTVEDNAFYGQYGISSVYVPGNVLSVGNYAFANCAKLENAEIENGTLKLGSGVFISCQNLRTVSIPVSVTEIGSFAFYDCPNLSMIFYGGTQENWRKISRDTYWNKNTVKCTVICADGMINY